jgi:5-methylcytosine-specific restriction endonuclease McrA
MSKPTYSDSNGTKYTTEQIERKISKSAKEYIEMQFIEDGYNYCENCGQSSGTYLDVSHTISRKKAKEDGCVEVLWDWGNLEILCRKCHQIKDKLV